MALGFEKAISIGLAFEPSLPLRQDARPVLLQRVRGP